jgi:hypothetical protein
MGDNNQIKNLLTIINNKTYNITPIMNGTSNNSFLNDKNNNFIFLGIIFILLLILIISILILIFLFKKKKRVNYVSNNIDLNKIVIDNSNNNNPNNNIVEQKGGFQKVQNTSKVNDLIQPNNVLNEIKTNNLKDEINKIINTSNSSGSLGIGKRSRRKRGNNSSLNNSGNSSGKGDSLEINNNNNDLVNKDEKKTSDINTQQLEQELKAQIKRFVVEENNI